MLISDIRLSKFWPFQRIYCLQSTLLIIIYIIFRFRTVFISLKDIFGFSNIIIPVGTSGKSEVHLKRETISYHTYNLKSFIS